MQYYTYDQSESEATIVVDYPDRDVLAKNMVASFNIIGWKDCLKEMKTRIYMEKNTDIFLHLIMVCLI